MFSNFPQCGEVIAGQLGIEMKLSKIIGSGGAGLVYLAIDINLPKNRYAVKCVRNTKLAYGEVKMHKAVSGHRNIVSVYEIITKGAFLFVVMELCPGGDLFDAITSRGMFTFQDDLIKSVFMQILDAVQWCHDRKVSHRDIKTENILCNDDCSQIWLADFGIACKERYSVDFGCGTNPYMSPECKGSERDYLAYSTVASDVWALGIVLLGLVTGSHPWDESDSSDECFAAFLRDPDYLTTTMLVSEEMDSLLRLIFTADAATRISIVELRTAVRNIKSFYPPDLSDSTCGEEEYFTEIPHTILRVLSVGSMGLSVKSPYTSKRLSWTSFSCSSLNAPVGPRPMPPMDLENYLPTIEQLELPFIRCPDLSLNSTCSSDSSDSEGQITPPLQVTQVPLDMKFFIASHFGDWPDTCRGKKSTNLSRLLEY